MSPTITQIETFEFTYSLPDVRRNPKGFDLVYEPGKELERTTYAVRIETDTGVAGEYVGSNPPAFAQIDMVADYLVDRNPLAREKLWSEMKRSLRKYDRMGMGPIDIALWDFAGKYYDAPIHELLGTYRAELPAYASTYFGSPDDGLDSPAAYADFAEECLGLGYPAYKIHPWGGLDGRDIADDVAIVRAVGERVGDEMDLMMDPVCEYETWADALTVGKACDEQSFFWYEDPYSDGGTSMHAHRKLADALETPLLQGEMLRGLESHADLMANDSADLVRADPEWDGGITGAMKIARAAESFGLDVEYHLSGPAQRHCLAATRNSNYYELGLVHPGCGAPHAEAPVYAGGYTDAMDEVAADGTFPVPEGPGLGVEYDWEYIEGNRLGGRVH